MTSSAEDDNEEEEGLEEISIQESGDLQLSAIISGG